MSAEIRSRTEGLDGFFSLRDGIALGDFPENRFSLFFQGVRVLGGNFATKVRYHRRESQGKKEGEMRREMING